MDNSPKSKNRCQHDIQYQNDKSKNESYFYCFKCNNLVLIYNNKKYCTNRIMSNDEEEDNEDKNEFDPILVVRNMIRRQDEQIKDINDKLVLNYSSSNLNEDNKEANGNMNNKTNGMNGKDKDDNNEDSKNKAKIRNLKRVNKTLENSFADKENNKFAKIIFDDEVFEKYCEKRNKILIYIHKLCTKLKYNDNSFYLSLYLADTFMSRIFSEDITEKELFLVVLGFFLISTKYIEDDIFEPEFGIFCNIEKSIPLTIDEIRTIEIQCLALVNYNLYIFTAYDWLNILLNNGITFEIEVTDTDILDKIFLYTQKILTVITSKTYFCKYTSMQVAFSIIHLSREKYINKNRKLSDNLYKSLISLYGVEFSDYEQCYKEIKRGISESGEMEEEEEEEEDSKMNTKRNNNNLNINTNSLEINIIGSNEPKTLSKEKDYNWDTISRKNRFKVSRDKNKASKYMKTDMNANMKKKVLSSPDEESFNIQKIKYKLKNGDLNYMKNHSLGILDNLYNSKKVGSNLISNSNNSLNNTSVKSCNYNAYNQPRHITVDCNVNDKNTISNEKRAKTNNNSIYINYAPKYSLKNNGQNINNINYINNISIINDPANLYSKKMQKNISSNSNSNFGYKINNNKNYDELRSNTNNNLKKTLFNLDNIIPTQLNYEYNLNTINNNKIKLGNNNSNKIQNVIILNNNNINIYKNNFKKLNTHNKEKFKTHLLLDVQNNLNGNNILKNNNQIIMPTNKESKSFNKYTVKDYDNFNSKFKKFRFNKGDIKIMNTNININFNNNLKTRKITLNFRDLVNKKIMEHKNNFLPKEKNENIRKFNSLNSNFYNKDSANNIKENKIYKENENRNDIKNVPIFKDNPSIKEGLLNKIMKNNNLGKMPSNINNFKNIVSIKSKLPKLKINKTSLLSNN